MADQVNKTARLEVDGKTVELPVMVGTEGEKAIDIRKLRAETGYVTHDPGYGNTGACDSSITYIDGDQGILRHRGYAIEDLCKHSSFVEVSYLLIHGALPTKEEFARFEKDIRYHSLIHEDMKSFFNSYPGQAHPMAILSSMVCSLSAYYPSLLQPDQSPDERNQTAVKLLSKVRVLAAFAYKRSVGQPFIYPSNDLEFTPNFLRMMFAVPAEEYVPPPAVVRALELLFILHADHEQNCSTSTVRMVGSSKANLFASVSAGVCALWGPLHGGANQAVIEMLEMIRQDGGGYAKYIEKAKDKKDPFRLMGFGHRVYKNYDPRARILKGACDEVLAQLGRGDETLDIARGLEEAALNDPYFIERKLFPNVDFYSGIIYRAIGIPANMFTVMFALGRLPGWIAQWKELVEDPGMRIARPRQVYTGETERSYVPIDQR